jgi:DNA-binding transcriptional MerR regulator
VPDAAPPPDPAAADAADEEWLTVDDLARLSGIPSRTIRFYRESKLLPQGSRVGRRSLYPRSELDRLRVIADLRAQGLGLEPIARLLDDPDGQHLAAIAAAGAELRRPWTEDRAATMTRLEVIETLGVERSESIDNLVKYGVIVPVGAPDGPEAFQVPSVTLLQIVGDLKHAGLGAEFMYLAWQAMQKHLSALAAELLDLYVGGGFDGPPAQVADTFAEMRPVALRAVQHVFATAAGHALADFVERGGTAAPPPGP